MNPYDDTDNKFIDASILLCCRGCVDITLADNGAITDVYSTKRDMEHNYSDWFQIAKKHVGRTPNPEFFTIIQHISNLFSLYLY
jgi:hypothetical protein